MTEAADGGRNIAFCFDGTRNRADQLHPTNVARTWRAASGADADAQIAVYDRGVGTDRGKRVRGAAVGLGLARNVAEAADTLARIARPADRIFMFGFSRGAYTARSLAGLLGLCGLPAPDRVAEAMRIYRLPARRRAEAARRFGGEPRAVRFLGVWDTVGALGVPGVTDRRHRWHDTSLGAHVREGWHALAYHELRRHYRPIHWTGAARPGQTVRQFWFAGAHSDVGGGLAETGHSDQALAWMWTGAAAAGLRLDPAAIAALDPRWEAPIDQSSTGIHRLAGRRVRRVDTIRERLHMSLIHRLAHDARAPTAGERGRGFSLDPPA